jgi:hypothetical protein
LFTHLEISKMMKTQESSTEGLAKEFYLSIHKPAVVRNLLIQDPTILHYKDPQKGNALQAALKNTVNNENSALIILNYGESHQMINSQEEDMNNCPFFLAILKGNIDIITDELQLILNRIL